MIDIRFLTTGYAKKRQNSLSITALTDEELWIARVTGDMRGITRQIKDCETLTTALGNIPSRRKTETTIPIDRIRSMRWMKRESAFRVTFDDERGRIRTRTTHIQTFADRLKLVDLLGEAIGHQLQRREEPAPIWRIAGAELLGALFSVAGTAR